VWVVFLLIGIGGFQASAQHSLKLKSGTFQLPFMQDPAAHLAQVQPQEIHNDSYTRIIQFTQLPTDAQKQQLERLGLQFTSYLPDNAYLVEIPVQLATSVWQGKNIHSIYPVAPEFKLDPRLVRGDIPNYAWEGQEVRMTVQWLRAVDPILQSQIVQAAEGRLGNPKMSGAKFTEIVLPLEKIWDLAAYPQVLFIEPGDDPGQPEDVRGLSQHRSNILHAPGREYDGEGVTVSVRDNFSNTHLDWINRNDTVYNVFANGTHGTQVTGVVAGAGNLDPSVIGMAPKAFVYQMDYTSTFQDATVTLHKTQRLVVTNSSYSNGCNAGYTNTTRLVDEQAYDNPSLLHVFSAGNSGTSNCNYGAGAGWGNVTGGHKLGKNVIATAALNSTDGLAGFSSIGPATDGRIKPDISAFGQGVRMTNQNNTYVSSSGTSFSAPGMAGISAQLYHAYRDLNNNQDPDAALIKAVMLNTADDLGNAGPDFRFGWGRVNALRSAEVLENVQYLADTLSTGETNSHTISVPAGVAEVRVMIYWADPEASTLASKALVNDLDMTAVDGATTYNPLILDPTPTVAALNSPAVQGVDTLNNMEQVRIVNPGSSIVIDVAGSSVPMGPAKYYMTYDFIYDEVNVTYPNGGEHFAPADVQRVRWDAYGNTGNFTMEYSSDNGNTWIVVNNNIPADRRYYDFTVPNDVTGEALIRVTRGNLTGVSENPFNIIGIPSNIQVLGVCPGDITRMSWTNVPGATHYDVYMLADKFMDSVGTVVTNSTQEYQVPGIPTNGDFWISVRARKKTEVLGRRAIALLRPGGRNNCPIENDVAMRQSTFTEEGPFYTCVTNLSRVKVNIKNESDLGFFTIPLAYQLGNEPVVRDTFQGFLAPGSNTDYIFTSNFQFATAGDLELRTWVEYPGDSVGVNDTIYSRVLVVDGQPVELPYRESFETFTNCNTTADCGQVNCALPDSWTNLVNGRHDQIDWRVNSGPTPTIGTGPVQDQFPGTPGGKYLYLEADGACDQALSGLITPCIDLVGVATPQMEFWYHMRGPGVGQLHVDVYRLGFWTNDVMTFPISGNQGFEWNSRQIDLTPYRNAVVLVRFRATMGSGELGDIAIDNISFTDPNRPPRADFITNRSKLCVGEKIQLEDLSFNFPQIYDWSFTPNLVTYENNTAATDAEPVVSFQQEGWYRVQLRVSNSAGADSLVRDAYIEVTNGEAPNLIEDFENIATFQQDWTILNPDNSFSWQPRTVNGITGQSTEAIFMDNFQYNGVFAEDELISWVVNLENSASPELTFDMAYARKSAGSLDSLNILISTDCGQSFTERVYANGGLAMATSVDNPLAFFPASSAEWRSEAIDLSAYNGQRIIVKFVSKTLIGNNLFLDNIGVSERGSAAPVAGFNANPFIICKGETISFEDASTGPAATTYSWDFGVDASPATANTAGPFNVTYTTGGTKFVTLTVGDGTSTNTVTKAIEIETGADPFFTVQMTGLDGQFTSQATNATHVWDFGDGSTSTDVSPNYVYTSPGLYTITHIVTPTNGCPADTFSREVGAYFVSNDPTLSADLSIYPNPSKDIFWVEALNMPVGEAAIQVFDLSGKALNLNVEMIQGKAKLDLSGYAQGIYMLEWKQGPYTLHQKLIKE